MASEDLRLVILDAGPVIHLDELGCLRLLEGFSEIQIPSVVWDEVRAHRPLLTLQSLPGAEIIDPKNEFSVQPLRQNLNPFPRVPAA